MFRLAHISDVHFSPMPKIHWREMLNKRLTGYMNWHKIFGGRSSHYRREYLDELMAKIKAADVDHLAITGDLVNLGSSQEFLNVENWLSTIDDSKNISLVFGNHDEYVRDIFCSKPRLQPYMGVGTPYLQEKKNSPQLLYHLRRVRETQAYPQSKAHLHHSQQVGNKRPYRVAIIGVNSAEPTPPLMAHGYFRAKQANELAKILKETNHMFRIILIHHPPIVSTKNKFLRPHKNLVGAELFQDTIKKYGCELVLHGHTHKADFAYIGNTPVVGTTSASAADAQFNLFTIFQKEKKTWDCKLEIFSRHKKIGEKNLNIVSQ